MWFNEQICMSYALVINLALYLFTTALGKPLLLPYNFFLSILICFFPCIDLKALILNNNCLKSAEEIEKLPNLNSLGT